MNIKLFFEISKEFFDSMYSYLEEDETEYTTEEGMTNEEDTTNEKKIDEEKGWNEYGGDDNLCYCNGCNIYRQFALFIDPNIDNDKSD